MTASRKSRRPARGKRTVRMWGVFMGGKLVTFDHSGERLYMPAIYRYKWRAEGVGEDRPPGHRHLFQPQAEEAHPWMRPKD